jgi:hypothetical protein
MTPQPEQHQSTRKLPTPWTTETADAFADLCQNNEINPVRLRKLVDTYIATKQKPSRQELVDALKHRPKIQERAAILSTITKQLNILIETHIKDRL